jgi:DNA-binding response OmpR family regulator
MITGVARLLVVDDDPRIRRLLEVILSARHEVVALASAREALEYLKGNTPDLMVLDVMMPEMDGLALLGRVRMVKRLKEVPVVMLTGGGQEFRDPARMLGADVFLEKPVGGKKLNEVVEALLSRKGFLLPGGEVVSSLEEVGPYLRQALPLEEEFRRLWRRASSREALLRNLLVKGWTEGLLWRILPGPYDFYDLLGHLAYGWPLVTRKERARSCPPSPLLERYLEEGLLSEELDLLADCLYS